MPRAEDIRDRLPSLYRPDGEETAGGPLAVSPHDVVALTVAAELEPSAVRLAGRTLVAEFSEPVTLREVHLAPARAPGNAHALDVFLLDGDTPRAVPAATAPVRDGVAVFRVGVRADRLGLQLKRRGLLTLLLQGCGDLLDHADRDVTDVLQSHWFRYADRPDLDRYFVRAHALGDGGAPIDFPYVRDLARLGGLLALPPWREPGEPEVVAEYRQRLERVVAVYRSGTGTVGAVRRIVEASLPVDRHAAPERRDASFFVEEHAPAPARTVDASAEAVPPLSAWELSNSAGFASPVTVEVVGAGAGAERPVVELFEAYGHRPRLGIAYLGTVPTGSTLVIKPAFSSWLAAETGVLRARSLPGAADADPSAPGPWSQMPITTRFQLGTSSRIGIDTRLDTEVARGTVDVRALHQSADRALWAAVETPDGGEVWRYDGNSWRFAITGLPTLHCLAEDDGHLLIGTASGLLRMDLYPEDGEEFRAEPTRTNLEPPIYAVLHAADGTWWFGTADGVYGGPAQALRKFLKGVHAYALSEDAMRFVYVGSDRGLFQFQPVTDRWYWYAGRDREEQAADWRTLGSALPAEEEVGLPPVTAVHRGRDSSLWIGTTEGIARYVADAGEGLVYDTVLEAFPDLGVGSVHAIREDERGTVWFCTDRGLLTYDGRDLFQVRNSGRTPLGRADTLYQLDEEPVPRGAWRYTRGERSRWERFERRDWTAARVRLRTSKESPVRDVVWTDDAVAALDGQPVDPGTLVLRLKASERRIIDGGLAATPRLPPGTSVWRYLSREPVPIDPPSERPSWTCEGRLLPAPGRKSPPEPPAPGRFGGPAASASTFDWAVHPYPPQARVRLRWEPRELMSVLVRLPAPGGVDPAVLDRVWQAVEQVRPAGVRTVLAVGETIVRGGETHGIAG